VCFQAKRSEVDGNSTDRKPGKRDGWTKLPIGGPWRLYRPDGRSVPHARWQWLTGTRFRSHRPDGMPVIGRVARGSLGGVAGPPTRRRQNELEFVARCFNRMCRPHGGAGQGYQSGVSVPGTLTPRPASRNSAGGLNVTIIKGCRPSLPAACVPARNTGPWCRARRSTPAWCWCRRGVPV